jgi:hypothetical protein
MRYAALETPISRLALCCRSATTRFRGTAFRLCGARLATEAIAVDVDFNFAGPDPTRQGRCLLRPSCLGPQSRLGPVVDLPPSPNSLLSRKIFRVIQNPRHCLPIPYLPAPYPPLHVTQRKNPLLDPLIRLRLRHSLRQSRSQKNRHVLPQKSGARKQIQQKPHPPRPITSFLPQFPPRPRHKTLLPIPPPSHQLPQIPLHAMSVLPYQHNPPVTQHRQYHHRPRMDDNVPRSLQPSRLDHPLALYIKHPRAQNRFAAQNLRSSIFLRHIRSSHSVRDKYSNPPWALVTFS